MYRGVRVAPGDFGVGIGSAQGPVILSAIGKIKTAIGSVTIARANATAIHPAVGDFVYEGDLVETGIDGQVGIIFLDGTTFYLYDSARVVLDEFIYDAEKSSNSALLRVTKGMFGFVSGKVATTGRLIIDTPLAKIQNAAPAASIGSLAFVFFLCLIDELEASSQNIALLDDGAIVYKDLEHGIFEIVTKERVPRIIVVDDPAETIVLRLGSSGISVDHVANTPAQMAQLQIAYQGAYATYSQAQQDPFIQQLQQQGTTGDQHANAQQSTSPGSTSSSGSSTPPDVTSTTGTTTVAQNNTPSSTNTGSTPPPSPPPPPPPVTFSNTPTTTFTTTGPGTVPATITALPISNDQHTSVFLGPSNAQNANVPLSITVPATPVGETLVSINIAGLPSGETITDGNNNIFSGPNITIPAANFLSGLTLSGNAFAPGILTITATVSGPSGLATSSANLALTVDLQTPPPGPPGPSDVTQRWINPIGGDWNNPANWSTGAVPIPFQDVIIDLAGNYVITSANGVSIDSLLFSVSSGVTLHITGGTFSLTTADSAPLSNAGTIMVGSGGKLEIGQSAFLNSVTNTGKLQVNGGTLDLVNLTVTNTGGTTQVDASSTLNLKAANINSGTLTVSGMFNSTGTSSITDAAITIGSTGTLKSTSGKLTIDPSTINNAGTLEAAGGELDLNDISTFTNSGLLLATSNSLLVLNGDTIDNTGGTVRADLNSTIDLQNTSINHGTITNHGLLEATGGTSSTIENATSFTNSGELLATGSGTALVLKSETVANAGGTVQVDLNSTLDLQTTTINNGTFDNSGLFEATVGANAIHAATSITNHTGATLEVDGLGVAGVTLTVDNAGTFTNQGKLLATGKGELFLINDTIANAGGTVQVDVNSIIDLQTTTINNGTFDNSGLFEATVGANAIHAATSITNHTGATLEVDGLGVAGVTLTVDNAGTFTNQGKLLATGKGELFLINDTIANAGGTVQVDVNSIIDLQTTTINNGTFDNSGLFEATVGANAIHAATSITNHTGATLEVDSLGVAGVTLTVDNAGTFTNQGKLLATGKGELFLINDTIANAGGTVQVDVNSIIDLQTTTINNGTFDNSGLFEATVGANAIHAATSITNHTGATLEVDGLGVAGVTLTVDNAGTFTNQGKLLATGKGELFLINDTIANAGGTVQVDVNSIIDLQTTTINNGTFDNSGLFEATVGANAIHAATSITNHIRGDAGSRWPRCRRRHADRRQCRNIHQPGQAAGDRQGRTVPDQRYDRQCRRHGPSRRQFNHRPADHHHQQWDVR